MFWGHEGTSIPGTKNFMYCSPSENTGVIVLTNSSDNILEIWNIFLLIWGFSRDSDRDGIIAGFDICPNVYNPDQTFVDADGDGYPDICEPDVDHDGVLTEVDNCPNIANADQADADVDGIGDVCDNCTDTDHDGFGNPGFATNTCAVDNCPTVINPTQADANSDGIGDACCCAGTTGNVNYTGIVDLSDLSSLVSYLTGGGYVLPCPNESNVNATGIVDLSDLSALVSYLTGGGYVLPNCP
ncbi:hypothetical protein C3F09_05885 [candidate division GN15 bacterium]|uniref:Dockerin domain-containing protein n=1 Tax=candidate division GN15 bacterium TaxID=2072418 RepID=A0A855X1E8_9BACT|nr:MAG: hypothetical protein C3F09_05885 [candidate division GN15 bacterium]